MVQHCARGRPPLPSSSPTLPTAARDTVPQRRGLFSGAARTLPGSGRRANDILYIRVRRREGEHVLHRAAGNDVDNFSVDNPLWITAAGGCRLLRGGKWKAMRGKCERGRGKCERGRGSANADGAGTEAFAGDGCSQERLSAPWPRFHGVDRADVYIIIRVRASRCGECALNPPPSPPIPRRRPAPAPALSHSLPAHFRSPTQPRRTPAGCAMHSSPTSQPISRRRPAPAPAATHPSRAFSHPLPAHFHSPTQRRRTSASYAMHSSPTSQHIPRRKPAPAPARQHALPAPMHAPSRRRRTFPTEDLRPSPQRHAASPSVPLRAQKNGTAQWMCDAECLGRPSLRSVIGVCEPRAVRRRCGALAWRVGLRPQPWALRSRRCGRVLRA